MTKAKFKEGATIGNIFDDTLAMTKAMVDMGGDYDSRVVGRVERDDNNGLGVSSCWTSDSGFETALLPKGHKIVIVERYDNREDCAVGHEKWVAFAADEDNKTALDVGYGESIAESTMPIR